MLQSGFFFQSFVKKVKSRLSGFVPPSLSRWFATSEKPNSRQREESEDDIVHVEPPTKRVKRPTDTIEEDYSSNSNLEANSIYPEPIAGPSGVSFTRSSVITENDFQNDSEDKDSDDEGSTSGYSSMARHGSKDHFSDNSKQFSFTRKSETVNPSIRTLNIKRTTRK